MDRWDRILVQDRCSVITTRHVSLRYLLLATHSETPLSTTILPAQILELNKLLEPPLERNKRDSSHLAAVVVSS